MVPDGLKSLISLVELVADNGVVEGLCAIPAAGGAVRLDVTIEKENVAEAVIVPRIKESLVDVEFPFGQEVIGGVRLDHIECIGAVFSDNEPLRRTLDHTACDQKSIYVFISVIGETLIYTVVARLKSSSVTGVGGVDSGTPCDSVVFVVNIAARADDSLDSDWTDKFFPVEVLFLDQLLVPETVIGGGGAARNDYTVAVFGVVLNGKTDILEVALAG